MIRWRWLLLGAALTACGPREDQPLSPSGFVGAELPTPLSKPDLTFTDSRGNPFPLVESTRGKVTLLFFGYTHCPDVCPVHLGNLAAVLDRMPDKVQRAVQVIFVTTDPRRDSLPVLDRWVKGFSPTFIGLTAPDSIVIEAERLLQLPPAVKDSTGLLVGHASQVIAFTRDGLGRVEYPFGTRQRDWAHDLPRLVDFDGE